MLQSVFTSARERLEKGGQFPSDDESGTDGEDVEGEGERAEEEEEEENGGEEDDEDGQY